MTKRKLKAKKPQVVVDDAGAAKLHAIALARRHRDLNKRITAGARELRRAVRQADTARIEVARELLTGTEYAVVGRELIREYRDTISRLENRIGEMEDALKRAESEVAQLTASGW